MVTQRSGIAPRLYGVSFILMASANFFTVSSFGFFFLFPLFITNHGGSEADIGIIMGAFSLTSVLCRPWISEMIDGIGRKKSYTIGSLMMSLLPLAYLSFHGDLHQFYLPLILIRLLHGVGLAICFTSVITYVVDIIPEKRLNEGIGLFGVTGLTGMALGPVLAEIIIRNFGFSFFFLAAAVMAVLGLVLHLFVSESFVRGPHESRHSFFSVLFKQRVFTAALLALLFGFGLAASSGFVSPFGHEQNIRFISLYYLCYSAAAVMTRLLGGRLADRIGETQVIPYALLLSGVGLLMLIFPGGIKILVLAGLTSGCGHGFLFPCLGSFVIRHEPANIRGKVNGVFTAAIDTGTLAGSVIFGYIGEWAGFRALFSVASLALLSGSWLFKIRIRRGMND